MRVSGSGLAIVLWALAKFRTWTQTASQGPSLWLKALGSSPQLRRAENFETNYYGNVILEIEKRTRWFYCDLKKPDDELKDGKWEFELHWNWPTRSPELTEKEG